MDSIPNFFYKNKNALFLFLPAQKGPTESKANPEGHWLLRSPTTERKAKLTDLLEC